MVDPLPRPEIRLYGRAGCELCDETRALLTALLAERAAAGAPTAQLVEVDIEADPALERAFLTSIPVVEAGGRRLELATSLTALRQLLAEGLDGPAGDRTAMTPASAPGATAGR